jgi:hypothetical protein
LSPGSWFNILTCYDFNLAKKTPKQLKKKYLCLGQIGLPKPSATALLSGQRQKEQALFV